MPPLDGASVALQRCIALLVVVSMSTTASSHDELTTMIANRDDEKLAVIGIASS